MDWEVRKIQAKCTTLEKRLAAQRPRGRARNRRQVTPDRDGGPRQPPGPEARDGTLRRSGQHEPVPEAGPDAWAPIDEERDLEAQRLISSSSEVEASKEPVLYHYQDVLNSVQQILIVAGAAFSLSVTL